LKDAIKKSKNGIKKFFKPVKNLKDAIKESGNGF